MLKKTCFMMMVLALFSVTVYGIEGKININTATESELSALPGIGNGIAKRIVEYREEYSGFKSTDELIMVKGIGRKKYEKIKELVIIIPISEEAGSG